MGGGFGIGGGVEEGHAKSRKRARGLQSNLAQGYSMSQNIPGQRLDTVVNETLAEDEREAVDREDKDTDNTRLQSHRNAPINF